MKATIQDVAKEAGVSITTVSKVLNHHTVGRKSKEKVLKVMKRLKYQPHDEETHFMENKTGAIGCLVPDLSNPFMGEVVRKLEAQANAKGFHLLICSTDFMEEKEANYVSLLRAKKVEGFILAGNFKNTAVLKELVGEGMPVTMIMEAHPSFSLHTVKVDDYMGGYQATSFLLFLGHERIGMIAEDATSSRDRVEGYKQALRDKGIKPDANLVKISDSTVEDACYLTDVLLSMAEPPTAIFACNDLLAIGALTAAREKNLCVPADLSIVGFDNTLIARSSDPPLTTIAQPIDEMCVRAVELLVGEIENEEKTKQRIVMFPELVVRTSTGSPGEVTKRVDQS